MFVKDKITEAASPKSQYQRYEDPTGDFGSKQLKYSLWFVQHKVLLYRILIGLLIAICAGEWIYNLTALGWYVAVGLQQDQKMLASQTQFIDYTKFYTHTAPQQLAVVTTQVIAGGVKKFDVLSEVVNPNEHFLVTFDYYFIVGGVRTQSRQTTLLPLDDRPLVVFGLESESYPGDASIVIENQAWHRIPVSTASDPKSWQAARLDFQVKNFEFVSAESPDSAKTNIVRFDFLNNTAYSYQEPQFVVGLYSKQALVGVLPLTLPTFSTIETKPVDLRNFVNNISVDEIKVFPMINLYDPSSYLPPPV